MLNEVLWFVSLLLTLGMVLVFYRFFGRVGLHVSIVLSIVLCNIEVLKQVRLFGINTTLGNTLYASIFLATDMLGEFYGKKEARRGVILGFLAMFLAAVHMTFAVNYAPSDFDTAHAPLKAVFGLVPGIAFASLAAYVASQYHDVVIYDVIKRKTKGRHLWLRNNASTMLSQLIDTAVFTTIATMFGVFPLAAAPEIFLTAYFFKLVVAVLDTPFIYLALFFKPRERE